MHHAPAIMLSTMISQLRRIPSAALLLVQLLGLLLYPWMEQSPAAHALLSGFGLLVLGVALWPCGRNGGFPWSPSFSAFPGGVCRLLPGSAPPRGFPLQLPRWEPASSSSPTAAL